MTDSIGLELAGPDSSCNCASEHSPCTPEGPTLRLLIGGTQSGFYCIGCLPGMLEAITSVAVNAALMKATTKPGDLVSWSGIPMTVLETKDYGVRTDHDFLDGWFTWEVVEPVSGEA